MKMQCKRCGEWYEVSRKRAKQIEAEGGFKCLDCQATEAQAQIRLEERAGELDARREAYHRARALRHGGPKLHRRKDGKKVFQ